MRAQSGTCTWNGWIVVGSGFASTCACPSAVEGNKSSAPSRSPRTARLSFLLSRSSFSWALSPFHWLTSVKADRRRLTLRSHSLASLIRLDWIRRSIRPPARGNHEIVDRFRNAPELRMQHDGGTGLIRTPSGPVHEWRVDHQVSDPVVVPVIAQVLFFRHHVGHGSRFQGRHPLLYECLHAFEDLSFGLTGQYHLSPSMRQWQEGAGSRRVVADRPSNSRIPKHVSAIPLEWAHPRSFHGAYETILAFDCGFVAMPSKDEDVSIACA